MDGAAIVFALRSLRKPSLAYAAGIAFGIGVAVRPTNILLAIPLAIAMRFRWKIIARAIAGAIPIAIALMIFNAIVYGNPLTTGYGNVSYLLGFGPCLREIRASACLKDLSKSARSLSSSTGNSSIVVTGTMVVRRCFRSEVALVMIEF